MHVLLIFSNMHIIPQTYTYYLLLMVRIWNLVFHGVPESKWRGWSRRSGTRRGAEVEAERASQS